MLEVKLDFLDMPGPTFLGFYFVVLAAALSVAITLAIRLRRPGGVRTPSGFRPDPYDLAYLTGGPGGVGRTALATLVHRGVVKVDPAKQRFETAAPARSGLSAAELAVYEAARAGGPQPARVLGRVVAPAAERIHDRLAAAGLATTPGRAWAIRLLPAIPMLLAASLGVTKISVGLSRHRSVGYLIAMVAMAVFIAFLFTVCGVRTTAAGDRLAADAKRKQSALAATAKSAPASLAPADVAMAFALFGPLAFASGPIHDTQRFFQPAASNGGSSCGSGGSSCSSSDGGGSSCGGGGCGGCGGGGGD
jgi:uncharacterized protein (TIGR04222 family)